MDCTPPPSLSKSGLKLVCNVNIIYGNFKAGYSQDYAQKPQQNCMFMNSAAGTVLATACQVYIPYFLISASIDLPTYVPVFYYFLLSESCSWVSERIEIFCAYENLHVCLMLMYVF
jgi:hypothetical protein